MIKFVLALTLWLVWPSSAATTNTFTVTAYCGCSTCCGKWSSLNRTADGHRPQQGVTCAAPRAIPFGTRLQIAGVGTRIVQDRLAVKYNSRIDVFFQSHREALEFGRQRLVVVY